MSSPLRSPFAVFAPVALVIAAISSVSGCSSTFDGSQVAVSVKANKAGVATVPVEMKLDHPLSDGDGKDFGTGDTIAIPALGDGTKIEGSVQVAFYGPRTIDYKIFEKGARIAWVRCWTVEETEKGPLFAHNYTGDKTEYRIEATPTFAACADVQN